MKTERFDEQLKIVDHEQSIFCNLSDLRYGAGGGWLKAAV